MDARVKPSHDKVSGAFSAPPWFPCFNGAVTRNGAVTITSEVISLPRSVRHPPPIDERVWETGDGWNCGGRKWTARRYGGRAGDLRHRLPPQSRPRGRVHAVADSGARRHAP